MGKICWISRMRSTGEWVLYTKKGDDSPAKCECAFDCYPTATRYTGSRGEAVDRNLLYAINEFIEDDYVFIGII